MGRMLPQQTLRLQSFTVLFAAVVRLATATCALLLRDRYRYSTYGICCKHSELLCGKVCINGELITQGAQLSGFCAFDGL